jgi:hypothetical protein
MKVVHKEIFPLETIKHTVTINPVATTESRHMAIQPKSLSRGVLSNKTGVNGETIRYYEKIKLKPEPG